MGVCYTVDCWQRAVEMPEGSYTAKQLAAGPSRIAQKVIEEAGETGLAAASGATDEGPAGSPGATGAQGQSGIGDG